MKSLFIAEFIIVTVRGGRIAWFVLANAIHVVVVVVVGRCASQVMAPPPSMKNRDTDSWPERIGTTQWRQKTAQGSR